MGGPPVAHRAAAAPRPCPRHRLAEPIVGPSTPRRAASSSGSRRACHAAARAARPCARSRSGARTFRASPRGRASSRTHSSHERGHRASLPHPAPRRSRCRQAPVLRGVCRAFPLPSSWLANAAARRERFAGDGKGARRGCAPARPQEAAARGVLAPPLRVPYACRLSRRDVDGHDGVHGVFKAFAAAAGGAVHVRGNVGGAGRCPCLLFARSLDASRRAPTAASCSLRQARFSTGTASGWPPRRGGGGRRTARRAITRPEVSVDDDDIRRGGDGIEPGDHRLPSLEHRPLVDVALVGDFVGVDRGRLAQQKHAPDGQR